VINLLGAYRKAYSDSVSLRKDSYRYEVPREQRTLNKFLEKHVVTEKANAERLKSQSHRSPHPAPRGSFTTTLACIVGLTIYPAGSLNTPRQKNISAKHAISCPHTLSCPVPNYILFTRNHPPPSALRACFSHPQVAYTPCGGGPSTYTLSPDIFDGTDIVICDCYLPQVPHERSTKRMDLAHTLLVLPPDRLRT
jgi:hypothetical protein